MSYQSEMRPERPMRDVLNDWAEEVAHFLGRTQAMILEEGLSARDFSSEYTVEIAYGGDLVFRFLSAFVVMRPALNEACVFSEHMGYREFALHDETRVSLIHEKRYYHALSP